MQLTVFELPSNVADAAYNITKAQLTATATVAADEEVKKAVSSRPPSSAVLRSSELEAGSSMTIHEAPDESSQHEGGDEQNIAVLPMYTDEVNEMGEEVPMIQQPMISPAEQADIDLRKGYVEERLHTTVLERYPPTAFRIVGYDPKSKRKVTLGVEPQAVIEVAGGVFSPYLDPMKRKELAKVICDALILVFPSGKPFDLLMPWSGAKKEISTAIVTKGETKLSERSGAERVLKRPGKLFRSALRISKYELLVTVYSHIISQVANTEENSNNRQLIFNFYSPAVSEACELIVTETEQIERLGRPVLHFGEGVQRSMSIRRFCRYFCAEIIEDILEPIKKKLDIILLPPDKGYLTEYQQVGNSHPGEDIRPVGIPGVFFPIDTCGKPLHREGMNLPCRDRNIPNKDVLVTVYTKSLSENTERGLVLKLYDRAISETSILHIGASELIRLCNYFDEPDLLRDIVYAQNEEDTLKLDDIEQGFSELTVKGDLHRKTQNLIGKLMKIVLEDLGFYISPQETIVPYLRSGPRGILPS